MISSISVVVKDLSYRINQHLNKEFAHAFTASANDWVLFFYYDDVEYQQARRVEQHIKNMKSRKYIQNLKDYPEILDKLLERYQ